MLWVRRVRLSTLPDMLDALRADRPEIPQTPIITLGPEAGRLVKGTESVRWLRKWPTDKGYDAILLTALDRNRLDAQRPWAGCGL